MIFGFWIAAEMMGYMYCQNIRLLHKDASVLLSWVEYKIKTIGFQSSEDHGHWPWVHLGGYPDLIDF